VTENRAVGFARELERDDGRIAAALAEVSELAAAVDDVRARVGEAREVLAASPERLADAEAAESSAAENLERRRSELAEAERTLAQAEQKPKDREALAAARRAAVRTRDADAMGRRRLERAQAAREHVESEAAAAERAAPDLERRAGELAARLGHVGRLSRSGLEPPEPGLDGTLEWAGRARAALFVVRSGLEGERERVIRQANELLASVAGEPAYAASVAVVRERLEAGAGRV
jgi:chromosome segregation ATPase